ncbi:MAG: hypothetical protein U5N86_00775 [Planctomycetota bacterium]|nr:hypothetical protein [Planctomycetota bacterium]
MEAGFGPYHATLPNPRSIYPDDGHFIDVEPDKEIDSGRHGIQLKTAKIFRDHFTTFIAHFDTGDEETVFWADEGTAGEQEPLSNDMIVSEDPQENCVDDWGVNFANGGTLSYETENSIVWSEGENQRDMMDPIEIEFWVKLDQEWDYSTEQVLFELRGDMEHETA